MDRRAVIVSGLALPLLANAGPVLDVRDFGARGDGKALDHDAVNRAIAEAARRGGTVLLPAGRYLCFSIRLKSHVTLVLGEGAVIEAADPAVHAGAYDLPEPTKHDVYQDFGHSHWQNSLIWGDGLEDIRVLGPGTIHGVGLTRHGPGPRWLKAGSHPVSMAGMPRADMATLEPARARMNGQANKAIALRNCRRVTLDGFTVLKGGHFAILATGVRDLTIRSLGIDTDRDGIDIDACRDVTITGCRVNSPNDDAIVLKASLALGVREPCANIRIKDCLVSGYDFGTLLDGTKTRTQQLAPDRDRVTGRIKIGTESNGDFQGISIADCRFERCRGLALETVDGGVLEDVTVSNITMHEVTTAPLFLRTGDRRRGPEGTGLGAIRGVTISNLTATHIDPRYAASVVGLPDSPVEEVKLTNIHLTYQGGGTPEEAARIVPDARDSYPEPSMFGVLPAHGLYIRDARNVAADHFEIATETPDARPAVIVERGENVRINREPR